MLSLDQDVHICITMFQYRSHTEGTPILSTKDEPGITTGDVKSVLAPQLSDLFTEKADC